MRKTLDYIKSGKADFKNSDNEKIDFHYMKCMHTCIIFAFAKSACPGQPLQPIANVLFINPLQYNKLSGWSKFKAFADDKINAS